MDPRGHRINFTVEGRPAFVEIRTRGWTEFTYRCVVDNQVIPEVTQVIKSAKEQDVQVSAIPAAVSFPHSAASSSSLSSSLL